MNKPCTLILKPDEASALLKLVKSEIASLTELLMTAVDNGWNDPNPKELVGHLRTVQSIHTMLEQGSGEPKC